MPVWPLGGVCQFLSTLPVRGATNSGYINFTNLNISIHAPREGSDRLSIIQMAPSPHNFYPRSP